MELDRWCFVNERGDATSTSDAELRSAFAEGRLGPDTWVWRSGWKQWLEAGHVRQFSKVLGDRARDVKDPIVDLRQRQPPPVPTADRLPGPSARFSTPIPPPHRPKPLVRRPPIPTINEASSTLGGDTLRPPGAVPPPPRGTPKAQLGEGEGWELPLDEETLQRIPTDLDAPSHRPSAGALRHASGNTPSHVPNTTNGAPPSKGASPGATPSSALAMASEEPDLDVPAEELSAPIQPKLDLPPISYDPDRIENRPSTPNLHVRVWTRMQSAPRERRIAIALVALATVSLTLGFWLTLRKPKAPVSYAAPTPSTISKPIPPQACSVARAAQRISPSVLMSVAPIVSDLTTSGRMVVGFAEGPTIASGLTIDPTDLDVRFPFREASDARVVSVTPLMHGEHPVFHVVRDNQPLKQARAVAASTDFLFGLTEAGFTRQPIGGTPEAVWAVEARTAVTDPRVSSLSGLGHAVTFRQGGIGGTLYLGWLTEEGRALAGPYQIKSPTTMVGVPSVATGNGRALITYAGRNNDAEPWTIHLSAAEVGQPPLPATPFSQPPGGPSGDSIAPTIVALSGRRWLLQWSEGVQGQRQVRIQTLDGDGRPIGPANTVSPMGSNSGQGLLWSAKQWAVSLFMVSIGKSAELWATPVSCPE